MQEQVYQTPIHDVNDLKQRLLDVWAAVEQRNIYYFVNLNFGIHKVQTLVSFYLLNKILRCFAILLLIDFSKYLGSFVTI